MRNFKDEQGNTWGVEINRPMLRKVQQELGVLLTELWKDDAALLLQLAEDPLFAGDVLWVLCSDQAEKRDVDEKQFVTLTDGDCFEHAMKAVIYAIVDFFPNSQQRATMRAALEAGDKLTPQIQDTIKEVFPKAIEMEVEAIKQRLIGWRSTMNGAESSESTEKTKAFVS